MAKRLPALIFFFLGALATAGCGNNMDTSWHIHQGELHKEDKALGKIQPGEDAWRFVAEAQEGDTLPGGRKAGQYDVLWEWRMELENVSDSPFEIKVKYFLVTADKELGIASSEDPPGKDAMKVIQPGEKKHFTGKGFIDKKDVSRIAKGRGRFGIRPLQKDIVGPRKEIRK